MNKNTFIGIFLLFFVYELSIGQTTETNKAKIYLPIVEINSNSLKSVLDEIITKEKKCFPSERYLYIGIREYRDEFNYIFIGEIEPSKELSEVLNKMPLACFKYKEVTCLITYCESNKNLLPSSLFRDTNKKQSFTLPIVNQKAIYMYDYIPSHWSYITFDNYKSLTIENEYSRCK
jgi:hypothetical protein